MNDKLEIRNDRLFATDRTTLFDAFADPDKLALWWGPEGFTNVISRFDLIPGGEWLITMTADNGTDFHNRWTFDSVVEGELIRMTHHEPVHVFTLEMRFSDEGRGARLSWHMLFDRTEDTELLEKFLHAANEQNFDRLERLLDRQDGER
ncbi:MAG: SRPBCC domain-containing protein [Hoeflea sp.]|uniref:SRPBCC domain-containing protein n=1 Tax=Hoeflea sp. TaxID=1940281 RepID=UPI0032EC1FCD